MSCRFNTVLALPGPLPQCVLENGRLAMLAFSGIIHHYFITGKGPVELMTGA